MNITTRGVDEVKVVSLEGELDTNTSSNAETHLNELISEGATKILLNFEKLDFISSSGLRILLATAQNLKVSGGGIRICSLNETVKEVFDISGFSTLLSVFDNEEKAMDGF
jgi:anti-sigma B factor antagonist